MERTQGDCNIKGVGRAYAERGDCTRGSRENHEMDPRKQGIKHFNMSMATSVSATGIQLGKD